MLPSDIETSARQQYNAVGDTFFPSSNFYNWIWQAEMILAKKVTVIEGLSSATSTVINQQAYSYPTNAYMIKRIAVNGRKLKPISFRQDDAVTLQNAASLQSGQPAYYTLWNNSIYLRPLPDAVYTMSIWSFNLPTIITSASQALDVPIEYHMDIVDYCCYRMYAQDKNSEMAALHKNAWEDHVKEAMSARRRKIRGDSFGDTQSEENLPTTILGSI